MCRSFPNLSLPACVTWDFAKRSKYSTILQTPQSQRHPAAATLQQSVIYELELSYEFLKNKGITYSDDMAYLQEFYEAVRGGYGWFTFDPSQLNLCSMSVVQDVTKLRNGFFGVGDGVSTAFPLWRSTSALGGGTVTRCELIQNVTLLAGVYENGVLVPSGGYMLANRGAPPQGGAWITFTAAPPLGATLTWAGNYSYLCKFSEDMLELNEFLYQFWELKSLKLDTINL